MSAFSWVTCAHLLYEYVTRRGLAGGTEGSLSRDIWSDGSTSSPRMGSISSLLLASLTFKLDASSPNVQTLELLL